MAIFSIVLRKMLKNKWLILCLLVGLIISIALVSSIPIYSSAVLQRILVKDLESYQIESGRYAGSYEINLYFKAGIKTDAKKGIYDQTLKYVKNDIPRMLNIPAHILVEDMETEPFDMKPEDPKKVDSGPARVAKIEALSDFESHVIVIDGKLPAKEPVNGVYESLVTEGALSKLKMVLGNVFLMKVPVDGGFMTCKVKPVGVFTTKATTDLYWSRSSSLYDERFFINVDLFKRDFVNTPQPLVKSINWYYALDYQKIMVSNIQSIQDSQFTITKYTNNLYDGIKTYAPFLETLKKYIPQQKQITTLLLALNVPVLLMLSFYLFMVSFLVIEADRNEIALLRSRGAARWHIIFQYFLEGLILVGLAFAIGPFVGLLLARFLGTSSGFLEFVSRKALPVSLNQDVYRYSFIASVIFIVMLIMPAYRASGVTIVGHKQAMARSVGKVWWKKAFIDIILIVIASFGIYVFGNLQNIIALAGIDPSVLPSVLSVSPLLFFASTLFALGVGLFFLRIYPLLIEAIYRIGRRWWSPPLYETLTHVGRSSRQYQFLMIFLIMTIATGLFSAISARTLNQNIEERLLYQNGAEISAMPIWQHEGGEAIVASDASNSTSPAAAPAPAKSGSKAAEGTAADAPRSGQYLEPPFLSYEQLPGVEAAAKVFKRTAASVEISGGAVENIELMAINPYDFGKTAWFRTDLLAPNHLNQYLNLLSMDPRAVLVSKSMRDKYKLKTGDVVKVGWPGVNSVSFIVYGAVDYFPSWNPLAKVDGSEEDPNPKNMLVVANLSYVQNNLALEPYEIWMKLKKDATSASLYNGIKQAKLNIDWIHDAKQEIIKVRNKPSQLGMNGAMTLGFIISLVITFLGFLLYWILAIRGRIYEFGLLRAMGISLSQLIVMMIWEQLLTSGIAIVIGVAIGGITSKLFVPFLEVTYAWTSQVPPFRVIAQAGDRTKLYVILGVILGIGLLLLGNIIARIKINQAIKLGED